MDEALNQLDASLSRLCDFKLKSETERAKHETELMSCLVSLYQNNTRHQYDVVISGKKSLSNKRVDSAGIYRVSCGAGPSRDFRPRVPEYELFLQSIEKENGTSEGASAIE